MRPPFSALMTLLPPASQPVSSPQLQFSPRPASASELCILHFRMQSPILVLISCESLPMAIILISLYGILLKRNPGQYSVRPTESPSERCTIIHLGCCLRRTSHTGVPFLVSCESCLSSREDAHPPLPSILTRHLFQATSSIAENKAPRAWRVLIITLLRTTD